MTSVLRWPGAVSRLALLAVGGSLLVAANAYSSVASQSAVWIDAPVDGSVFELADGPIRVVGHVTAALFLLDRNDGSVVRTIKQIIEPAFGRPSLAFTEDAAWYFGFVDGYPVRVDLETGRQTYVRLADGFAAGVVTDGTTVWFAVESFFADSSVVGIDAAEAATKSRALDR